MFNVSFKNLMSRSICASVYSNLQLCRLLPRKYRICIQNYLSSLHIVSMAGNAVLVGVFSFNLRQKEIVCEPYYSFNPIIQAFRLSVSEL